MNRSERFLSGQVARWVLVCAVCLGSLVLVGAVAAETGEAPDCGEVSYVETDDGQFEIENVSQLQCIEDNGLDGDYVLVDDIDASETEEWNDGEGFDPIGDYDNNADVEFMGTLDGANHTIEGLFIDRPDENWVGLFARAEGATIENVGLVDADVTGNEWVGSLAGANAIGAKITESYATGNVTSDHASVGGLVGKNTGATISNSYAAVTVSGDAWRAGGLVGRNEGTVSNSYATGNVTGEIQVGGLAGRSDDELSESYATGTVTASDRQVGGLAGWIRDGSSVSDSYATGDVIGGDSDAGGLVGRSSSSSISGSYATGTVTGDSEVGGLLGQNSDFGEGDGRVSQSYATGNVTGQTNVGGLVGYSEGSVEDAYWDDEAATVVEDDDEVEGQSDGGTPLSTAEMTGANAPENMDGFAFPDGDGTWHATDDYPALAWANTDSYFGVNVTETNSPIDGGDILKVTADVTNWGADGEQTVELLDVEDAQQDTKTVTLDSGDPDEVTLAWETEVSDAGTGDVTVASENDADSEGVTIETGIDSMIATIDDDETPTVVTGETVAVTVTVEDETGDPVEGAELSVDEIGDGGDDVTVGGLSDGETETTDSDGVATFDGVTFSGAIDATVDVTVSAEDDTEDVMTVTVGGFAAGDGSASDPYVITDWYHLDNVRLHLDGAFELGGTLDEETDGYDDVASETANGGDGFEPIGECDAVACDLDEGASPFSGTFDGNDTEISGLVINSENSENGLFAGAGGATIENVRLHDIDIDIDTADDFPRTGGIVGWLTDSELTRSSVTGEIVSAQDSETGVGGLVGENWGGTIEQSYANTTVTGGDDQYVGGLVGFNFDDTLFHGKGSISDSYATGDVSGGADDRGLGVGTGGLVGGNSGDISNSYATGDVDADENVGGLVGANSGDITSSYWDDQAATVTEDGEAQDGQGVGDGGGDVTALTTIEMTGANAQDNTDLDFDDTWSVVDEPEDGYEIGYPVLQNATQEPAPGLQTRYAGGDGSADSPYEIENWHHLDNVRENLDANFTLAADLDEETEGYGGDGESGVVLNESGELVDGAGFDPIGEFQDEFNGSFDGTGHTIENLTIDRESENYVGLFGAVDSATLENLSLVNVSITGDATVGGLAGETGDDVRNVSVSGTVSGASGFVGALTGLNFEGEIVDVSTSADVEGADFVGGVVGESQDEIRSATASGDVDGGRYVGGLIGYSVVNSNVTDSVATGAVNGTGEAVGGLVGYQQDGTITRSIATGAVEGSEDVGGMVGQNSGATITESTARGDVTGGELGTGGLVGWNNDGTVSNASAKGAVTGDEFVGGLIGENMGTVSTSYATGVVDDESADAAGGLVGENDGDVTDSYWDSETTGQNDSAGSPEESGLTTDELTGLNTTTNMDGFVFPNSEGTWHVTEAYPALAWEDTGPFFEVVITETNSPVEAGETLTVTASVTNWADDGTQQVTLTDTGYNADQQDTTDITVETGQSATVELDWTTDAGDAGTGEVTVASESHAATETVTVEATDEDSDSDPDSGPDSGPDDGEDTFRIETVHETHDEFQQLRVSIVNSPPYQRFDLRLTDPSVTLEPQHPFDLRVTRGNETAEMSDAGSALTNVTLDVGDVRVENLTFRTLDGGALSLVGTASSEPLADTPDAEFPEPGMAGLAYLDVTTTFDAEDVTFTFRVEKDAIAELASTPEAVSLHQYNETTGLWDTRETTLVEEDAENETLVYETTADSFSAWAVGAERPLLELVETNLDATIVAVGESVTVEATVENSGSLDGETAVALTVDGEPVDSGQITVGAGATEQVTFTHTFEAAGEYTLEANGVSVADVTVEADEPQEDDSEDDIPPEGSTDDTDESTDDADESTDDADDDGAGLGVLAAVLALCALVSVKLIIRLTQT